MLVSDTRAVPFFNLIFILFWWVLAMYLAQKWNKIMTHGFIELCIIAFIFSLSCPPIIGEDMKFSMTYMSLALAQILHFLLAYLYYKKVLTTVDKISI